MEVTFLGLVTLTFDLDHQTRPRHPWLADLAAPIGSQEIVDHTHKWWKLTGQHLPVCRLGPQVSAGWVPCWQYLGLSTLPGGDPTCTQASVDQSAVTICGCGKQLPGTQRVRPSQLTRGEDIIKGNPCTKFCDYLAYVKRFSRRRHPDSEPTRGPYEISPG